LGPCDLDFGVGGVSEERWVAYNIRKTFRFLVTFIFFIW
jgi:hypothetical protein